jgi:hypothetical protein
MGFALRRLPYVGWVERSETHRLSSRLPYRAGPRIDAG